MEELHLHHAWFQDKMGKVHRFQYVHVHFNEIKKIHDDKYLPDNSLLKIDINTYTSKTNKRSTIEQISNRKIVRICTYPVW